MTNLPVPMGPTGPSSQDISEMKRLMEVMNGGVPATQTHQATYSGGHQPLNESYSAPYSAGVPGVASPEEVEQMKGWLTAINRLSGEDEAPTPQQLNEHAVPAHMPSAPVAPNSYGVVTAITESAGKEREVYDVVFMASRQPVLEGLVVREAALGVARLMNKGNVLESAKVQELIDLEETYNRNRIEAGTIKGRYQRATQLGETEAADVFKSRFNKVKAEALMAMDQIKSITASIR